MDENIIISSHIERVLNQLPKLHGLAKEYIVNYLSGAPDWLIDSIQITKVEKDTIIIREASKVNSVYFLVDGIVKAIDYRFLGNSYDYMWFYPVKNFGGMEILLDLDLYQTTLSTMTSCTLLVIPKEMFSNWLKSDISAISMEVKSFGTYLLEEAKRERVYLFMQALDRVIYTLTQVYEQTSLNKICTIRLTHQDLSNRTGLSVKTITRSLKKLEQESLIDKSGNKIIIHYIQYNMMMDIISKILGT